MPTRSIRLRPSLSRRHTVSVCPHSVTRPGISPVQGAPDCCPMRPPGRYARNPRFEGVELEPCVLLFGRNPRISDVHKNGGLFYPLLTGQLYIHHKARQRPSPARWQPRQEDDQFLHPCFRRQGNYETRAHRYSKGRANGSYLRVSFPPKGRSPGFREFAFARLTLRMSGRLTSRCRQFASKCNRLRGWQVDQGQEQA